MSFLRTLAAVGALLLAVAGAAAQSLVAGPNGAPLTLAAAVAQARDGDTIELLPGDYPGGLVVEQRRLTLRGQGKVRIVGNGKAANGVKALWTVRGGDVTIENLEFRGARAVDGSGAGVRQEGGKLTLRNIRLFDNEHGVYAANDEQAQLTIDACVVGAAPKVVGGLHHLLNIGRIGRVHVTGSRFQQGFEGHLVKTRARESFIGYNFIHDGMTGGASYEIDIANGGLATVIGNVIAQGPDNQNSTLVAYGTEGRAWDVNKLLLAHNTLVHHGWLPAWALRTFLDKLTPGAEVMAVNNLVVGPAIFGLGEQGRFEGNRHATAGMLRDVDTYAFELPPTSRLRHTGVDPQQAGGHDLAPKFEFEWPLGVRALPAPAAGWTPGAFQR